MSSAPKTQATEWSRTDEQVPEGWTPTTLEAVGKWSTGGTPSRKVSEYFGGGIPWVKSGDLNDGPVLATEETISRAGLENSAAKLLPCESLSIALYGATIGKLGILKMQAATNQACANCQVDPLISSNKFLFYYLLQQRQALIDAGQGGAQPNLTNQIVREWPIPLPPLREQQRIISQLDSIFHRSRSAKQHLSQVPAILRRFRHSVLAAACSGRLTTDWRDRHPRVSLVLPQENGRIKTRRGVPDNVEVPVDLADLELPSSWGLESVASLLKNGALRDIKDGNHGANHPKTAELGKHGLPFITAAQIKNYRIDYENAPKVSGAPLKRLKVGFAVEGDVILTHKGTVGRAAVNTRACVLTPQTTYYRCHTEVLDPRYLVYLLTSPLFYDQLAAVMSQTTRDFVPISEQYRLFLMLPPVEEQREISSRVDALFGFADQIQRACETASIRVESLTESALAKAFRGELVPTEAELARREDRDYEPACALLERIEAEITSSVGNSSMP